MQRKILGVEKRSFTTRTAPWNAPAAPAAAPIAAAAPAPVVNSAPAPPSEAAPATGADSAAAPPAEGDKAAAISPEASATDKAAEPAETITEAEESKRMARIARREKEGREKLAAERRTFEAERTQHAEGLRKVAILEQAMRTAQQDPVGFMRKAFGVEPQAILDAIIAEGKKPAATQQQQQASGQAAEVMARLAELEKNIQTSADERKRADQDRSVRDYKTTVVAPALDKTKHELTLRQLGDKAVDEVFALQQARYQVTADQVKKGLRDKPEVLTPAQAADRIEAHFRSLRDRLNGTSVTPGAPQAPPRNEAPAAPTSASPTPKPTPAEAQFSPLRSPPKSYSTKRVS